jgi:hypothetical protein
MNQKENQNQAKAFSKLIQKITLLMNEYECTCIVEDGIFLIKKSFPIESSKGKTIQLENFFGEITHLVSDLENLKLHVWQLKITALEIASTKITFELIVSVNPF